MIYWGYLILKKGCIVLCRKTMSSYRGMYESQSHLCHVHHAITSLIRSPIPLISQDLLPGLKLGSRSKLQSLGDAGRELLHRLLQQLRLNLIKLAERVEFLHPAFPESDIDREVLQRRSDLFLNRLGSRFIRVEIDVRRSGDTTLSLESSTHDLVCEFGTGLSHRESGGSTSCFGFNDFVSSELDSFDQGVSLGLVGENGRRNGGLGLRQERENGDSGVTTDDGDGVFGSFGGFTDNRGDEGGSSENVESGDTEQPVRQGKLNELAELQLPCTRGLESLLRF